MDFAQRNENSSDIYWCANSVNEKPKACDQLMRKARNLSEKRRRERFNGFIKQLANMVPLNSLSNKRLDKKSILRLSAAHLRFHQSPLSEASSASQSWKPQILRDEHFYDLIATTNSFTIITSAEAKIMFVSPTCEMFLGHSNHDMIGFDLSAFIHPSDFSAVDHRLQEAKRQMINKGALTSERITIRCRMKEKSQPRTEIVIYQYVSISGFLKMFPESTKTVKEICLKRYGGPPRRKHSTVSSLRTLFCGIVQMVKLDPRDLFLSEANENEYRTRLTLDGRLVDADHRISLITGHFPDEVRGNSAYDYIHEDDLPISLFAHKLMLSNSNGTGIIVHRLRTCSNSYVFLQSAGYLEYDKETGTVSHFVCVSKLLIDHEGMEERNKFVNKFTPHISNSSAKALYESLKVVVGPRCSELTYEQTTGLQPEKKLTKTQLVATVPLITPNNPLEAMQVIDQIAQRYGVVDRQMPVQNGSPGEFSVGYTSQDQQQARPYCGALPLLQQFNNSYGDILVNPMSTYASTGHPTYSINSMTQFNGVNQPMTGAIVFNFGEPNGAQMVPTQNFPSFSKGDISYSRFMSSTESQDTNGMNQDSDSSISAGSPSDSVIDYVPYRTDENSTFDVFQENCKTVNDFCSIGETIQAADQRICPENDFTNLESVPSMFSETETFNPMIFSDPRATSNLLSAQVWSETLETDLISENKV